MWKSKCLNFSRWLGTFNRCTNKNVDCIKLIKLVLFEDIKANLFVPSACGHVQSPPRTHLRPQTLVGKYWSKYIPMVVPHVCF